MRNRSEIVYTESLSSGDVVDEHMASMNYVKDGDSDNTDTENDRILADNRCSSDRNFNNQCYIEKRHRKKLQTSYAFLMSAWSLMNQYMPKFKKFVGRKQLI